MAKTSIAVLVSSGLDSAILLEELASKYEQVHPLFVKQGFVWEEAERYWLGELLTHYFYKTFPSIQPLRQLVVPLHDLYPHHWSFTGKEVPDEQSRDEAVYLPGRNLLLITKAALYGTQQGIHNIALGTLKGNPFADSTPSFFRKLETTLQEALSFSISIHTPYATFSKAEVLQRAKALPLELTFSCLNPQPGHQPCYHCNKCAEREKVLVKTSH